MITVQTLPGEVVAIKGREIMLYEKISPRKVQVVVLRGAVGVSPQVRDVSSTSVPREIWRILNGKANPNLRG